VTRRTVIGAWVKPASRFFFGGAVERIG